MNKKVERNYLEINFLEDLNEVSHFSDKYSIDLVDPVDFQLNKFFYKNIGKNHHWVDRLVWTEKQWIEYVSDKDVKKISNLQMERQGLLNFRLSKFSVHVAL